jgi:hypothetical protein
MALLPHFARALVGSMQDRTSDAQPRTSRRYTTYTTWPLPTMADKLRFILTSVQQHPIQDIHGQLVGRSPSTANTWIHLRHPVLNQALADQPRLPARTADEVAAMLTMPPPEGPAASPFLGMTGPNAPSHARQILRSSTRMTVARRSATRSTTSVCFMRLVTCAA